ncbi:hypothetical protein DEO72_LG7g320 [Vigna unguiculata]|uniref:Uncharacterized protein n=1 Tax=Vigna unguiculata TaxID=3917 RepID=A0A4D6MF04_VIGUN|nr:hypothetical protein DEO72_LG7g320 [Vigna unguiculata]
MGENPEQHQQSPEQQDCKNQPDMQVAAPSDGSAASKSRAQKRYVVKIRSDSETKRLIAGVKPDNRRKSVTEVGDGDGDGDKTSSGKGKVGKWKKKWGNRKVNPKKTNTEEREASGEGSGTTALEKEKASEKVTIESELKEKEDGLVKMNEVEERVGVLSINSGNGKEKAKSEEMKTGVRDFHQRRRYQQHSKVRVGRAEKNMVWVRKDEI